MTRSIGEDTLLSRCRCAFPPGFVMHVMLLDCGRRQSTPIAGDRGIGEIRSWLAIMVKTFKLNRREELSTMIDGARSAVHWRADIHSRITGAIVSTELIDLIEVRAGRIVSYIEYFVPC